MKFTVGLAAVATLLAANGASAVSEWGQCGGINYTGSKTCDAGLTCVYINDYYYQCQKGSATTTTTRTTTTTTRVGTTTTITSKTTTSSAPAGTQKFKYFGVNESSAEFGNTKWPGVLGTDYTWPTTSSVDFFIGKGFNTFRIAFLMERISPPANGLTGSFDATYLQGLKTIASYVTSKGGYAVLDPHNFMRYNNGVISDQNAWTTWWKNLATQFKNDPKIIFDLQNEPHDIDATTVASMMQAAVNAIRSVGATQLILVEGTSWTGAWTWTSSGNANAFSSFTDPANNFAIEMHQYLDSDGSGTSATCVSSTIGVDRITDATNWLKSKGFKGFLGEIGAGSNDQCIAAIKGALSLMQQPGSPWIGALWWAAGPWWGTYYQSIEPPNGPAIARILPEALQPFV
ncbi:hypothetical protein FRC04_006285 [Tulasnella sp. 424]|nr:hypothetical protein FRC04_006285 [Tulasnella sp. 424]KAG8980339.1 hypothetical protein FRC05_005969 [Tulasnella sp. 425]